MELRDQKFWRNFQYQPIIRVNFDLLPYFCGWIFHITGGPHPVWNPRAPCSLAAPRPEARATRLRSAGQLMGRLRSLLPQRQASRAPDDPTEPEQGERDVGPKIVPT